jgi:hypothetical protein
MRIASVLLLGSILPCTMGAAIGWFAAPQVSRLSRVAATDHWLSLTPARRSPIAPDRRDPAMESAFEEEEETSESEPDSLHSGTLTSLSPGFTSPRPVAACSRRYDPAPIQRQRPRVLRC